MAAGGAPSGWLQEIVALFNAAPDRDPRLPAPALPPEPAKRHGKIISTTHL